MYESIRAGRPLSLEEEPTLAEALSGGIGAVNRYTFPLIRELVDEHLVVGEEQIGAAVRHALSALNLVVEGGGAVALAAALFHKQEVVSGGCGAVGVLISGGNLSLARLAEVVRAAPA